ncbi:hypothetical protein [Deinococcus pimensis]|uniref:hypothetical protein n=1 Tax=Deinococcus pimensis TaxID=309888 RepID=UPI0004857229|nr:hypothetical protein [Deinococcus pimensis]
MKGDRWSAALAWRADLLGALGEVGYVRLREELTSRDEVYRGLSEAFSRAQARGLQGTDEEAELLERLLTREAEASLEGVVAQLDREGNEGVDSEWVDRQARRYFTEALTQENADDDSASTTEDA